jgi:hypothetical protein
MGPNIQIHIKKSPKEQPDVVSLLYNNEDELDFEVDKTAQIIRESKRSCLEEFYAHSSYYLLTKFRSHKYSRFKRKCLLTKYGAQI